MQALSSCSGTKNVCTVNCGGNNATVTLSISDTPPTRVSVMSMPLPIIGIALVPSTGGQVSLYAPPAPATSTTFELTRLQSDSAFITTNSAVPPGSYTAINVTILGTGGTPGIFYNGSNTTFTISTNNPTACVPGALCKLPPAVATTISFPLTLHLSSGQTQWIGLDFNLNNAITTTNGISVDFTQANVLEALTTPRTNIPVGGVDSIGDFTGIVTAVSSTSITVQSGTRGTLTAAITGITTYTDPQGRCSGGASISCITPNAIVSVDALLATGGAISAVNVDIIDASTTTADEVEGTIIFPTAVPNVAGMILYDKSVVSADPILSASTTTFGTGLFLTINPLDSTITYNVDSGTLSSQVPGTSAAFQGSGDLKNGQFIRVKLKNVAIVNSEITGIVTAVLLRNSVVPGTVGTTTSPSFTMNNLPSYFLDLNLSNPQSVQTYNPGTFFEGATNVSDLATPINRSVAIRALYLNPSKVTMPFLASKVRAN